MPCLANRHTAYGIIPKQYTVYNNSEIMIDILLISIKNNVFAKSSLYCSYFSKRQSYYDMFLFLYTFFTIATQCCKQCDTGVAIFRYLALNTPRHCFYPWRSPAQSTPHIPARSWVLGQGVLALVLARVRARAFSSYQTFPTKMIKLMCKCVYEKMILIYLLKKK